jgi:hypothetical protein
MHAECQSEVGDFEENVEERQGRAIILVSVAVTLLTLLLLVYGLFISE